MAISIVVDDRVTFKVNGTENDAKGVATPFDFSLTARRLDADELEAKRIAQSDQSFTDFLVEVVDGWDGPRDADKKPVPYSADMLRALLRRPGLAALSFRRYMVAVAVKEKN